MYDMATIFIFFEWMADNPFNNTYLPHAWLPQKNFYFRCDLLVSYSDVIYW